MPVGGYLADWVKAHLPGREMSVAVIASILAAGSPQPLVPSLIILSAGFLLAAFCYWRAGRLIAARAAMAEAHAVAAWVENPNKPSFSKRSISKATGI